MSRHTQIRRLGWTMLIVSSKCLTPIGTRGLLRPSQMPVFANVIVSVNLSPSMLECQGFLQSLDEGYSGAMTSWSSPGEQQARSGAGREKGWPQGWVKRKQWNTIIICYTDHHMENGTKRLEEGMGKIQPQIRTKLRKWKNEASVSTGGYIQKERQKTTWFLGESIMVSQNNTNN